MKQLLSLVAGLLLCSSALAKDPGPKTFLVLFKSKELKAVKTSIKQIESQFSIAFDTKIYEGNSELALLIDIPSCDFDECFLGEFLVDLSSGQKIQLQQIAFRLFDLTKNQLLHDKYQAMYEESLLQKKKALKSAKATPSLLGGPGY